MLDQPSPPQQRTIQERVLFWACFLFYVRASVLIAPGGCGHEDVLSLIQSVGSLILALLTAHLVPRFYPKLTSPLAAVFAIMFGLTWLLNGMQP